MLEGGWLCLQCSSSGKIATGTRAPRRGGKTEWWGVTEPAKKKALFYGKCIISYSPYFQLKSSGSKKISEIFSEPENQRKAYSRNDKIQWFQGQIQTSASSLVGSASVNSRFGPAALALKVLLWSSRWYLNLGSLAPLTRSAMYAQNEIKSSCLSSVLYSQFLNSETLGFFFFFF